MKKLELIISAIGLLKSYRKFKNVKFNSSFINPVRRNPDKGKTHTMKNIGIYKIINLVNGRFYIGSSRELTRRKTYHFCLLRNGKHDNPFLQNDFNKCGEQNFVFEVILETDCEDLLLDFEQSYLDEFYDNQINCYNINPIAQKPPSPKGRIISEETRKKLSDSAKGRVRTKEHCLNISKNRVGKRAGVDHPYFGKTHSEEIRKLISEKMTGRKLSEEHKRKIGKALKDKKRNAHIEIPNSN